MKPFVLKKTILSIEELAELAGFLFDARCHKILLEGELWAGKTEFVKQYAKILWITQVSSPTYTYINIYDDRFLHGDLYRIENEQYFLDLGILEQIENHEYVFLERPKFTDLYVDENWVKMKIEEVGGGKRKIEIRKIEMRK